MPSRWRVTDDTILTLATCKAIIGAEKIDPAEVASSMVEAFRSGRIPGLGASTLKALKDLAAGGHWATSGRSGELAAGNGAAMRIFPLAMILDGTTKEHRVLIRDVARITHKSDEAYVGALAVVRAAHLIADSAPTSSLLQTLARDLPDTRVRDAIQSLSELPDRVDSAAVAATTGTSAYVAESVPLALFIAFANRTSVESAVLGAIRCGGDTDTIASIAGQLVGSTGAPVPAQWRDAIPCREEIEAVGQRLRSVAQQLDCVVP